MGDQHVLTISGQYDHVKQVCAFVAAGAQQAGLDDDAIFKIELACDEACTNIIEHAYGGEGAGEIIAAWEADSNSFTMTLHDNGRSFDPGAVAKPALMQPDAEPNELRVGGLGIHFIRNLMDEIRYQFDAEQGNTLSMVKYIKPPPAQQRQGVWQKQIASDIWLVGAGGRLDQNLTPQLYEILTGLADHGRYRLIIDLSGVVYINSGGLRCLISAWRRARAENGDVILFGLNGRILEVFTMIGFDNVFHIYDTRQEAQAALP